MESILISKDSGPNLNFLMVKCNTAQSESRAVDTLEFF